METNSSILKEAKVDNRITHLVKVETLHLSIIKALEIPQLKGQTSKCNNQRSLS